MQVIQDIEREFLKAEVPDFSVGDTVDVGVRIREGEKERVQIFNGIVIRRQGSGARQTFTVRRIVGGEGVERIFPLHSPNVVDVVVKKRGRVRRAKLYYLRKRVGKGTRVREKLFEKKDKKSPAPEAAVAEVAAAPAEPKRDPEALAREKARAKAERAGKKKDKKAKRRVAKKKAPAEEKKDKK